MSTGRDAARLLHELTVREWVVSWDECIGGDANNSIVT